MSTTNDTRPEMGPVNWQDAFDAEFRRTQRLTATLAAERVKVAELVAALEAVSSAYDALIDADHGWERELSEQCEQVLSRCKEPARDWVIPVIPWKDYGNPRKG